MIQIIKKMISEKDKFLYLDRLVNRLQIFPKGSFNNSLLKSNYVSPSLVSPTEAHTLPFLNVNNLLSSYLFKDRISLANSYMNKQGTVNTLSAFSNVENGNKKIRRGRDKYLGVRQFLLKHKLEDVINIRSKKSSRILYKLLRNNKTCGY